MIRIRLSSWEFAVQLSACISFLCPRGCPKPSSQVRYICTKMSKTGKNMLSVPLKNLHMLQTLVEQNRPLTDKSLGICYGYRLLFGARMIYVRILLFRQTRACTCPSVCFYWILLDTKKSSARARVKAAARASGKACAYA